MIDLDLMKDFFNDKPAKIEANSDENGNIRILFEGRRIEILCLSLSIAVKIIKSANISVDKYINMLKEIFNDDITSEQSDVQNEIYRQIIESVFKK